MNKVENKKTDQTNNKKKYFTGVVVSDKMNKTIVVKVENYYKHSKYKKRIKKSKKYYVHDEQNVAKVNDVVHFVLTRPISKLKCFKLVNFDKLNSKKDK